MKRYFITGGTGSLGRALITRLLGDPEIERVCSYARCEQRAAELQASLGHHPALKVIIGDVRDLARLKEVMPGSEVIIHAAALKRVDGSTTHTGEIIRTNVEGTRNVLEAARVSGVQKVLLISSDKAVHACNPYGASKFLAECLTLEANQRGRHVGCLCAATRYGNVFASRGSVVGLWRRLAEDGLNPELTAIFMTRFWLTMPQAVDFVLRSVERMKGGEIFLPILPAAYLFELAEAIKPGAIMSVVGKREGGEKLHERLIADPEMDRARRFDDYIIINGDEIGGTPVDHPYESRTGPFGWLTVEEMREWLRTV